MPKVWQALLVDADQQTFLFLAAVKIVARVADDGHAKIERLEFGHGIGEEVHVLHRSDRMIDAEHAADFVDAVTGGVDHLLAGDIALFGVHDEFAVGLAGDALDRVEAIHFGACGACLARQRKGDAGRIDIAIERIPPGAQQAVGGHQRMATSGFGRVDKLHLDAHAARHADEVFIGIDLCLGMREAHAAGDVVGDRVFRIGRQFPV